MPSHSLRYPHNARRSSGDDAATTTTTASSSASSSSSSSQLSSSAQLREVDEGAFGEPEWAPAHQSRGRHHAYTREDGEAALHQGEDKGTYSDESGGEEVESEGRPSSPTRAAHAQAHGGVKGNRNGRREERRSSPTRAKGPHHRDRALVSPPRVRARSSRSSSSGSSSSSNSARRSGNHPHPGLGDDLPLAYAEHGATREEGADLGRRKAPPVDLDDVEVALREASRHSAEENPAPRQQARRDRGRPEQTREQPQGQQSGRGREPLPAGLSVMADPYVFTESTLLNYSAAERPWDSSLCEAACCHQPALCLCGGLCCLTAPVLIFQERQALLFHSVQSRYVCCLGTVPCCWPPAAVRPELYLTYTAPGREESRRGHARRAAQRLRDGVTDPNPSGRFSPKDKYPPVDEGHRPVMPPIASATGVSSVGSITNVVNGLPQYGSYHSVKQPRRGPGERGLPADGQSLPPHSGSCCLGCCCYYTPETNTCTLDSHRSCCLYWRHPTACCLAGCCPFCCLCAEVCCCMPCAALGNRVLIRRHYGLAPDPTLDDPVACLYCCCVTCLTGKDLEARRPAYADGTLAHERASCWQTVVRSLASCLAATCCLWPCLCCSLAQQRDMMERRGYPQLSAFRPSDITGMP